MRTLASIQVVNEIRPIVGADAIEAIRVLGWWVVVKKNEFQLGQPLVYCEIDSLLPERSEFEFLRKSCFKPEIMHLGEVYRPAGFRIKTIRLRGQVSQGLCLPLTVLPPGTPTDVGTDVTDVLGITKYEVPDFSEVGDGSSTFPGFLVKTDETRVQVLEQLLQELAGREFLMTEKLDGTSFTCFWHQDEFGVCSRNRQIDATNLEQPHARIANQLGLAEKLKWVKEKYGFSPAIQGELVGSGIQGNKYRMDRRQLFVFNLFNIDQAELVPHAFAMQLLQELELTSVPSLGTLVLNHSVDELLNLSVGKSTLNPNVEREGIVFRPETEEYCQRLQGRLSFKAINPQFLLKYDE
ncbi:MAG: RNA ligase (ATP) [Zavarzinella sp.]